MNIFFPDKHVIIMLTVSFIKLGRSSKMSQEASKPETGESSKPPSKDSDIPPSKGIDKPPLKDDDKSPSIGSDEPQSNGGQESPTQDSDDKPPSKDSDKRPSEPSSKGSDTNQEKGHAEDSSQKENAPKDSTSVEPAKAPPADVDGLYECASCPTRFSSFLYIRNLIYYFVKGDDEEAKKKGLESNSGPKLLTINENELDLIYILRHPTIGDHYRILHAPSGKYQLFNTAM